MLKYRVLLKKFFSGKWWFKFSNMASKVKKIRQKLIWTGFGYSRVRRHASPLSIIPRSDGRDIRRRSQEVPKFLQSISPTCRVDLGLYGIDFVTGLKRAQTYNDRNTYYLNFLFQILMSLYIFWYIHEIFFEYVTLYHK